MKNSSASRTRFVLNVASAAAFAVTVMTPQVHAAQVTPPSVPLNLEAPEGNRAYKVGYAVGTQNYVCMPTATGAAWAFHGPQATLFNDDDEQIITHFLSANPVENGTLRATWQHSNDTSAVWAVAIANSTDPAYVAAGAIPWLLLQIVGAEDGPTGGDKISATTYIQRVNTSGGVAPSTGCSVSTDVGKRAMVPYTTDYYFYKPTNHGE